MHPLLHHPRRLGLYLVAWLPISGLIALLLAAPGSLGGPAALALAVPLCLVYAFLCLSAWYSCRVLPLARVGLARALATYGLEAGFAAALWVVLARLLARGWDRLHGAAGLAPRLGQALALLWVAGVLLYLLAVGLFYLLLAVEASRAAEARLLQAGLLAREAELKALKAQVNPHFLFNSLNSISALTASDAGRAREMCVLLGDFLRRTLGLGEKAAIPLSEELSLVRAFLAVEMVRFGDRLRMEECIAPAVLDRLLPPLLLQPLVENAVVHGVANLVEGGWIRLEASAPDGRLRLVVLNSFDPEAPPRRQGGVGLANVRARLLARYGPTARLEVAAAGDRFQVTVIVPQGETA